MKAEVLIIRSQEWSLTENNVKREGVSISYIPLDGEPLTGDSKGYTIFNATLTKDNAKSIVAAPAFYELDMRMGQVKDSQRNTRQTVVPFAVLRLLGRADIFKMLPGFVDPLPPVPSSDLAADDPSKGMKKT